MESKGHTPNLIDEKIDSRFSEHIKPIHEKLNEIEEKIGKIHSKKRKANKIQPPTISFRLKSHEEKSILSKKAGELDMTISEYLRTCALSDERKVAPEDDGLKGELIEDITFLFQFFQKNAKNLDINDKERKKIGEILTKIKSVK